MLVIQVILLHRGNTSWTLEFFINNSKSVRFKYLQLCNWKLTNKGTLQSPVALNKICDICNMFLSFLATPSRTPPRISMKSWKFLFCILMSPKSRVLMKFKGFVYPLLSRLHTNAFWQTDLVSVSQSNAWKRNSLGRQGRLTD